MHRLVHRVHWLQEHLDRQWSPYAGHTRFRTLLVWTRRHNRLERVWHPWPAAWHAAALCIHRHESRDWHESSAWGVGDANSGGGLQFTVGTWLNYVVRGYEFAPLPELARKHDQLLGAWRLYQHDGDWHEWSTAAMCGVS